MADREPIRRIHLAAFPSPLEADLVERLEFDGDLVLSIVAEHDGEPIGHAAFSRMRVKSDERSYRALGLGPVAVLPGFQGGGAGSGLIEAGKAIAQATGEELIFVLGEPDYYSRFGFSADTARPFDSPFRGPYFMALKLSDDLEMPASGEADYAPAFGTPGEQAE